jgi:hypothetical protein
MKQIKCSVYSDWMCSLETAHITVNSPAGGYITLYKWQLADVSDELQELVWRCVNAGDTSDKTVLLTVDEMQLLTTYPKALIYRKKPATSRSFKKSPPKSYRDSCSGCNGDSLIIRDHGSWEGYYCKKCGAGGSRQKSGKFRR